MIGIHETQQHNWRCDYCPHTSWKTAAGAMGHVEREHPKDLEISRKNAEIARLKNKPPKIEVREKVVYRDAPKEDKTKFWSVPGLYCSNCKTAQRGGGIPIGQTVEDTPHSVCGTKSLMLVLNGEFM